MYDVVLVRAIVLVPVGPDASDPCSVFPRIHPVGPGVRAVSMYLAIAPRAHIRVSAGPDLHAVPILIAVAPRALIAVSAVPFVSARPMLLVVAPCAGVAVPIR